MIRNINELRHMKPRKGLQFRVVPPEEAAKIYAADRSARLNKDEFTRTLLAAKEGHIAPGEADRQIASRGGKVKLKRLSAPPIDD